MFNFEGSWFGDLRRLRTSELNSGPGIMEGIANSLFVMSKVQRIVRCECN